jgi:glycosyltransferase involved in cell wall biosynthesis
VPLQRLRKSPFVRAVAQRVALRSPADLGPQRWRDFVARTRRANAGGPGKPAKTLEQARQASDADPASFDAALAHLQLSKEGSEESRQVLERLVEIPPPSKHGTQAVVRALRHGPDRKLAERYQATLERAGLSWERERLSQVVAALELAELYQADRTVYRKKLEALPDEHTRPVRIAVEGLAVAEAWDDLADVVDPPEGSTPLRDVGEKFPADELTRAASRAFRAGSLSAAVRMARRVLQVQPDRSGALTIVADGQDQLDVIANGWRAPEAGEPGYEPRPRAVLSVLWQSVPIRSAGYATRSHGILTGLADRGWEIEAVTRLGFPYDRWPASDTRVVPPSDVVDGIRYHRLLREGERKYPTYPLQSYIDEFADGIVRHAKEHRAAMIHASSLHFAGLAGAAAARQLGLPYIYEIRGLLELLKEPHFPEFPTTEGSRFLEYLELESCKQADAVFVITEALRQDMARRGVPEAKMVVLPNGVHADKFAPRERDVELARELDVVDRPVIGYAGSLVGYEGLELLLEAIAELKAADVDLRAVIVGDGPNEHAVRAKAAQLRLGDVVTFTGRVPHEEVGRYISLFDITPFPRLPLRVCELVSPMKPFEAMAMGKAVVVSSVAALADFVDHERTGLVFDKGDRASLTKELRRLLESAELRRKLGQQAMEWVRAERDWSAISAIADEVYQDVLSRRAAQRP